MIYPHNFEQKIGFDQIRQLLKGKCLSTLGEERVDEMTFSDNYDEINQRLEQVVEFVRITQEEEDFPAQYFFDVRPSLKRIRVEGMYMDEQELFDLRRSLETIRDIVRFLQQSDEEEETENSPYPALRELAGDILVFPQLIARIDSIFLGSAVIYKNQPVVPQQYFLQTFGNHSLMWDWLQFPSILPFSVDEPE